MRKIYLLLPFSAVVIILISCGHASTKADVSDTLIKNTSDSEIKKERINDPAPQATTGMDSNIIKTRTETDILANIDQWLVSKVNYPVPGPNGGIVNGVVTVRNNLTDISFQKALVEVSILLADGKEYRTDYYTVINLEPGMTKTVKIPTTTRGNSVVSNIVKVKSTELTNGEWLLVGSHYVPR
ncbi:MAG: hypothetical protein ABIT05_03660 [Chitinophagaceae bacterium]